MKKTLIYLSALILLGLHFQKAAGQGHPILRSFSGYQDGDQVVLEWTIKGGFQCQGTFVYRSADSLNFHEIGAIYGICGGLPTDQKYTFRDSTPVPNKTNYYRLEMGGQGFTTILGIKYYTYNEDGYFLFNHPIKDQGKLVFENPDRNEVLISIYDIKGRKVKEYSTEGNSALLSKTELKSGTYIFHITHKEETAYKGKFVVL